MTVDLLCAIKSVSLRRADFHMRWYGNGYYRIADRLVFASILAFTRAAPLWLIVYAAVICVSPLIAGLNFRANITTTAAMLPTGSCAPGRIVGTWPRDALAMLAAQGQGLLHLLTAAARDAEIVR
jgi:hypothetical protein